MLPNGQNLKLDLRTAQYSKGGARGQIHIWESDDPEAPTFTTEDPGLVAALGAAKPAARRTAAVVSPPSTAVRRRRARVLFFAFALPLVALVLLHGLLLGPLGGAAVRLVPVGVDSQIGDAGIDEAIDHFCFKKDCRLQRPALRDAVQVMLDRLALSARTPQFSFRAHVIDSPIINAFALPGGNMVLTTGILRDMESADELAGVLAHEMGHVVRRHSIEHLIHSAGLKMLIFSWAGVGAEMAPYLIDEDDGRGFLRQLRFARNAEAEADVVGVRLLADAWIDPAGMLTFMRKLADLEAKSAFAKAPVFVRDHPVGSARTKAIGDAIAKIGPRDWLPLLVDWSAVRTELAEIDKLNRERFRKQHPDAFDAMPPP